MSVYAISDLHLSTANPKPMDIFGGNWTNHWEKIKYDWSKRVKDNDIVLIPGDISWALTLEDALPDILEISNMPGKKILTRGNHDYWWESPSKIRKILPGDMQIIQNDSIDIGNYNVCGTRGWILPEDDRFGDSDAKIFGRELIRLELSLSHASAFSNKDIIVMIHYPPFNEKNYNSAFLDILKKYNVKTCVYGHLHSESLKTAKEGVYNGIEFFVVSCDYLDFKLKKIA